jgi:hypothetical protein
MMIMSDKQDKPNDKKINLDFVRPKGYGWLIERGIIGYEPFGPLQPWHYLEGNKIFCVSDIWPTGPHKGLLISFAKRQDCDDYACFDVEESLVRSIMVIHGWTSSGYDILAIYKSFWEWLKSVIDDIAELVEGG